VTVDTQQSRADHTVQAEMSSEKDARAKLNMDHGFMQSIIKNQVDRDEYDKEQKLLQVQNKIAVSRRERPRSRRADQQVYVPPHLRGKAVDEPETSPQIPVKGKVQILGSVVFS